MAYPKTNWVENETPVSPGNMNKIEQGIDDAHKGIELLETSKISHSLATAAGQVLVSSGIGKFIVKTIAEIKVLLGLGSAAYTESTAYTQKADNSKQIPHIGTTTNSGDTYSVTTSESIGTNQKFTITFNAASSAAPKLSINGGTAYSIKRPNGNNAKVYASTYSLFWNGSNFILLGEGGEYGTAGAAQTSVGYTIGTENGIVAGTFTGDGDIEPNDIREGKIGYSKGAKKVGTAVGLNLDASSIPTNLYFGDGSDGSLVIPSGGIVTLPLDANGFVIKKYNNIRIDAGGTLTVASGCKAVVIYCKNDCIVNGIIDISSKGAFSTADTTRYFIDSNLNLTTIATGAKFEITGKGGAGGAGNPGQKWNNSAGYSTVTSGGSGMSADTFCGGQGGGGGGGGVFGDADSSGNATNGSAATTVSGGQGGNGGTFEGYVGGTGGQGAGAGGGGGGGPTYYYGGSKAGGGNGGQGGGASSILVLICRTSISGSGQIKNNGGNGGSGGSNGYGHGGGGSGGGAGGGSVFIVSYQALVSANLAITVNGGSGGTGGGIGTIAKTNW